MSSDLCLPKQVLDQHLVMLGKTGAGKSSAMRVLVEYLLDHGKRVVIADPKGDWWGVKSSADGKSAGYPVIAFGNFKEEKASDVPINAHSGQHVAELVATGNRPAVIGFRGWMPGEMTHFWVDFATHLFAKNAGELFLVIDEVHNFAPKGRTEDPMVAKSLNRTNRLMAEGRGLGIVVLCASQRPQKVHNDTLTSCETLVAMRVIHTADRNALKEWIDGCGDSARGKDLLANVASLERGSAYVWSPEIGFGPELVKFPMFRTFDSFAPPQLQKKVSNSGWADVDLGAVKEKLAVVIQEAEANDPKKLRARIAQLEQQARMKPVAPLLKPQSIEIPVLDPESRRELAEIKKIIDNLSDHLPSAIGRVRNSFVIIEQKISDACTSRLAPRPSPQRTVQSRAEDALRAEQPGPRGPCDIGSGGKRRILVALAQYPEGMGARRLSILCDIAKGGGTWRTYMAELRGAGYIVGGNDHMKLTRDGASALGAYDPLPVGEDLRQYWRNRLGDSGKRKIFDVVVAAYPNAVSADDLARETNIARGGGTWRTYLAELRGLELISGHNELIACDDLFS